MLESLQKKEQTMETTVPKLRKMIQKVLQESVKLSFSETIARNKEYIVGDPSLHYWLKQNRNPMTITEYATDPVSMPGHYIDMIETESLLQGTKCIGTIGAWSKNHRIILFADTAFTEYIVVFQNYKTQAIDTSVTIPVEPQLLVQIVDYVRLEQSGNAELDRYIS
jgi:hypothetical protein